MKYVGQCGITNEYLVHNELPSGITEIIRFKTAKEMDEAILADYYHGGTEEYLG